jgi:hypothetical protein
MGGSTLTTGAYWARWRGEQDIRRQVGAAWRVVGAYDRSGAMRHPAELAAHDAQS